MTNGNRSNYEVIGTSSHSSRPADTRFRSNSLPRNRAYGNVTGSRFIDDADISDIGHSSSLRNRGFSPSRNDNWARLPVHYDNRDASNYRDSRNAGHVIPIISGSNVGHADGIYNGTFPRTSSSGNRVSLPDGSMGIGVPKPVTYFTYSDDDEDKRAYNWDRNCKFPELFAPFSKHNLIYVQFIG
jgi:hypothetical protein